MAKRGVEDLPQNQGGKPRAKGYVGGLDSLSSVDLELSAPDTKAAAPNSVSTKELKTFAQNAVERAREDKIAARILAEDAATKAETLLIDKSTQTVNEGERRSRIGKITPKVAKETTPAVSPNGTEEHDEHMRQVLEKGKLKPVPTDRESLTIPENLRAYERTWEATIPENKKTAGFYNDLRMTQREGSRRRALDGTLRSALRTKKDSFTFTIDGEAKILTTADARKKLSEIDAGLGERRAKLEKLAEAHMSDPSLAKEVSNIRKKKSRAVYSALEKRMASAANETEMEEIRRDSEALGKADVYLATELGKNMDELGISGMARIANTQDAVDALLNKYNVTAIEKPAPVQKIKPAVKQAPDPVEPAPIKQKATPVAKVAPTPAVALPAQVDKEKQTPTKVSYERAQEARRKGSQTTPKKTTAEDTPASNVVLPPVAANTQKKQEALKNKETKTHTVALDGGGITPQTKEEIPFGIGLEGDGVAPQTKDEVPFGVGLEGDGVVPKVEATPFGVGLEGDGVVPKNSLESSLTPEEWKIIEAHRNAAAKQAERIQTEAEQKGFGPFMRSLGEKYSKLPWYYKASIGIGFAGVGLVGITAGGWLGATIAGISYAGGRSVSALGTWYALDSYTKKWENRTKAKALSIGGAAAMALLAPKLASWINMETGIGNWFAHQFGISGAPSVPASPNGANAPSVGVPTDTPELSVQKGDTLWGLTEKQLNQNPRFAGLDRAGKDFAIDSYMKKLGGMSPEQLRALGIHSGNINQLQIGEHLKLPILQDQGFFDSTVSGADALSPEQRANILKYRAGAGIGTPTVESAGPQATGTPVELISKSQQIFSGKVRDIFGSRVDRYTNFVSWKNPNYFINYQAYSPDVLSQETHMAPIEIERLRVELVRLTKEGLKGRTVEELLRAGAEKAAVK